MLTVAVLYMVAAGMYATGAITMMSSNPCFLKGAIPTWYASLFSGLRQMKSSPIPQATALPSACSYSS